MFGVAIICMSLYGSAPKRCDPKMEAIIACRYGKQPRPSFPASDSQLSPNVQASRLPKKNRSFPKTEAFGGRIEVKIVRNKTNRNANATQENHWTPDESRGRPISLEVCNVFQTVRIRLPRGPHNPIASSRPARRKQFSTVVPRMSRKKK